MYSTSFTALSICQNCQCVVIYLHPFFFTVSACLFCLSACHFVCLLVSLRHLSFSLFNLPFHLPVSQHPPEWINHQVRQFRGLGVKCGNNIHSWLIHFTPSRCRSPTLQAVCRVQCTIFTVQPRYYAFKVTVPYSFCSYGDNTTLESKYETLLICRLCCSTSPSCFSSWMCCPSLFENYQVRKPGKGNQFKL